MALNIFLGVCVAVVLMAILARMNSSRKAKRMATAFAGREPLQMEQFYERFFRERGASFDVVKGVREVLEVELDADMSRLADTDDFSKNLNFFWDFDSMANVEIVCSLEKRFAITIADEEAESTKTVRDIVELVSRKIGTPNAV